MGSPPRRLSHAFVLRFYPLYPLASAGRRADIAESTDIAILVLQNWTRSAIGATLFLVKCAGLTRQPRDLIANHWTLANVALTFQDNVGGPEHSILLLNRLQNGTLGSPL